MQAESTKNYEAVRRVVYYSVERQKTIAGTHDAGNKNTARISG